MAEIDLLKSVKHPWPSVPWVPYYWQVQSHHRIMPASIDKQSGAMEQLAWRITYEWNCAKNRCLTMDNMQTAWKDWIVQSAHYQCLAEKRKETIRFLWHHTRNKVLAENTIYGHWLNGSFYSSWSDLPESVRYDEAKIKTLPKGHFWGDGKGNATTIRYFISADSTGEHRSHFLKPAVSLPVLG